jgi:hypothetical protein
MALADGRVFWSVLHEAGGPCSMYTFWGNASTGYSNCTVAAVPGRCVKPLLLNVTYLGAAALAGGDWVDAWADVDDDLGALAVFYTRGAGDTAQFERMVQVNATGIGSLVADFSGVWAGVPAWSLNMPPAAVECLPVPYEGGSARTAAWRALVAGLRV